MCGCGSRPSLVTRLRVVSGHQLVKQDLLGGRSRAVTYYSESELIYHSEADPYVLIKCEGERFKSEPIRNSQNPVWNFSVLLYRCTSADGSYNRPIRQMIVQVQAGEGNQDPGVELQPGA